MKVFSAAFVALLACVSVLFAPSPALAGPKKPASPAAAAPAAAPPSHDDAQPDDAQPAQGAMTPAADPDVADAPPAKHAMVTERIGVELESISKFDIANSTFTVEMIVSIVCDHAPCNPEPIIRNGTLLGKPEKVHDEPLHKKFKLKGEVDGYVDLREFPYDQHQLQILIQDKADSEQIVYQPDPEHTKMGSRVRIAGWDIDFNPLLDAFEEDLEDGEKAAFVVFALDIQRPRLTATFKSIIPACFMLFVAGFALLLRPKSAPQRLTTATGGLMGLVMFHVGQINSLPPLGYLTRLDKFFVATYLVYLIHIAFSVMLVRSEEAKNEKRSELIYLISAGLVPGLALLLWMTVFCKLV